MRVRLRSVLTSLAIAFTAYLAVGGLWWTVPVDEPLMLIATLAFYLVTTWLCIFWQTRASLPTDPSMPTEGLGARAVLPPSAAVLALAAAIIVPSATWFAAGPDARLETFATWSLGGIGALMTIVVVRRRPWVAWFGIIALGIAAIGWIGLRQAVELGWVGAIVWVGLGQLATWSTDRAARDAARLTELQRSASEWLASQEGRSRERRIQVQRALAVAGPILERTVATGGMLDSDERVDARVAEGQLRDEMRGPRLLDDAVRARLESARRAGCTVTVLDEGGLDGVDEDALVVIRAELADTLVEAHSERLYIRTSPDDRVAVTVVGRSSSPRDDGHLGRGDDPDAGEDVVDLWHEIPHPPTV